MQEKLLLKQSRTGTTISYFDTQLADNSVDKLPAFVEFDTLGNPVSLKTYAGGSEVWRLNSSNINELAPNLTVTGYTYSSTIDHVLSLAELGRLESRFKSKMLNLANGQNTSYVFFENTEIDDMFVNVNLNRTYKTLDTLSIYNNPLQSMPIQEAGTGIVFGKLEAKQKIQDANGEFINIPLSNVPIGIFNESNAFPTTTSVDNDGNRIVLNLSEGAMSESDFFNTESISLDNEFLQSGSGYTSVPEQFKHITQTNENGEFIIHNAPTGSQVLIFEVDLLKQGLTKDEISNNRGFAFPGFGKPNVDEVPAYFFRQIPVDIVPAWGNNQSGYTELNINVNLDLRKWTTYYVPPMAYKGKGLRALAIEDGIDAPLTIEVRDMSKEGYPTEGHEIVEIQQTLENRDENQQLAWFTEFAVSKSKVQMRNDDYTVFKLPANMYDPNGYRTDKEGVPRDSNHPNGGESNRGVWLAGYQFKISYINEDTIFKSTGLQRDFLPEGAITRDHYHLNRNGAPVFETNTNTFESGIGMWPYEKPWDHTYPSTYSIPAMPTQRIPIIPKLPNGNTAIEYPKFSDGDLIGAVGGGGSGGFGAQLVFGAPIPNHFSKRVTNSFVYKYERGVSWGETYANGYSPNYGNGSQHEVPAGISHVVNGEHYQRMECGYAYWIKPEGWMRTFHFRNDGLFSDFDLVFEPDVKNENGFLSKGSELLGFESVSDYNGTVTNIQSLRNDMAMSLEAKDLNLKEEGLELYRIIEPAKIVDVSPPFVKQFVSLDIQSLYIQRGEGKGDSQIVQPKIQETGPGGDNMFFTWIGEGARAAQTTTAEDNFLSAEPPVSDGFRTSSEFSTLKRVELHITNLGLFPAEFKGRVIGSNKVEIFTIDDFQLDVEPILKLPANDGFNDNLSTFEKASYRISFHGINFYKDVGTETKANEHDGFINNIFHITNSGKVLPAGTQDSDPADINRYVSHPGVAGIIYDKYTQSYPYSSKFNVNTFLDVTDASNQIANKINLSFPVGEEGSEPTFKLVSYWNDISTNYFYSTYTKENVHYNNLVGKLFSENGMLKFMSYPIYDANGTLITAPIVSNVFPITNDSGLQCLDDFKLPASLFNVVLNIGGSDQEKMLKHSIAIDGMGFINPTHGSDNNSGVNKFEGNWQRSHFEPTGIVPNCANKTFDNGKKQLIPFKRVGDAENEVPNP